MALNATTCYNKAVAAAGYGSYPSPLAAAAGVPSAAMVAAAAAAVSSSAGGRGSSSRSSAASSSSASGSTGYRVKDFNVPLHVDCSVEYEMPSSAKPPVGGKVEPLLMIHPSYYRKAESRTRSLFVNNMPAVSSATPSGRSRPSLAAVQANRSAAHQQQRVDAADGPPPAKKPYAGPAPGVTAASTGAGVYGTVTGAAAAAVGAAQWPPLGSSAEHHHQQQRDGCSGKRTAADAVQRQYQQHLQASLPPPMLTAALPTDNSHIMAVPKGCSCCQAKILKRKAQQTQSVQQQQSQQQLPHQQHQLRHPQQHHNNIPQPTLLQQQQHLHHHQQQQQHHQQQQQQQQQLHHQQQQQQHHHHQQQQQQLHHHQQHQEYHKTRQSVPSPQLWGFNGTIAAVLRNEYGGKPAKSLGRITDPINNILTPTYMF